MNKEQTKTIKQDIIEICTNSGIWEMDRGITIEAMTSYHVRSNVYTKKDIKSVLVAVKSLIEDGVLTINFKEQKPSRVQMCDPDFDKASLSPIALYGLCKGTDLYETKRKADHEAHCSRLNCVASGSHPRYHKQWFTEGEASFFRLAQ